MASYTTAVPTEITRRSPLTGNVNTRTIMVSPAQLDELARPDRRNIQDIFPELSANDREFLLTGIPTEEWQELFGAEED